MSTDVTDVGLARPGVIIDVMHSRADHSRLPDLEMRFHEHRFIGSYLRGNRQRPGLAVFRILGDVLGLTWRVPFGGEPVRTSGCGTQERLDTPTELSCDRESDEVL